MRAGRRQSKVDEALDSHSIENSAFRGRQPKRLQRFPLLACEFVIEFRVHVAPKKLFREGCYIVNVNWLRRQCVGSSIKIFFKIAMSGDVIVHRRMTDDFL
jgi:hypothetical protein